MSEFRFESKKGSEVVVTFERDGEKMRFHFDGSAPAPGVLELAKKIQGYTPLWGAMMMKDVKDEDRVETAAIVLKLTNLLDELVRVATPAAGVA